MEIKVLQGINLENPITTIKITLDAQPKTEHLDLIKSFHPIFMRDYKIEGNTVSIQSKLTHYWKEAAIALNNEATGDWSQKEVKDYLLDEVTRRQVKSMSTIPILDAADKMDLEITQHYIDKGFWTKFGENLFNRQYTIGSGAYSSIVISIASSSDSKDATKAQRDKFITNSLINRLGLPIALWEVVESEDELEEVLGRYPKPVVIKPVGLTGGSGVTTNIDSLDKAKKAYQYAYKQIHAKTRPEWQQKIMIQQQVTGEDYRLLIVNGKLEIATKRIPAFVIGDGNSTIRQLIEETNKDPRRNIEDPTHTLKPIIFDEPLDEFLKEQNLTLDHVPQKDERIYVRKVASMSRGGITEDFTDKVHPHIRTICEILAKTTRAYVLGIDVFCQDISKPLTIDNGTITEINTMPEMYLNAFPVIGKQYVNIGTVFLQGLLEDKRPTKHVVSVGLSQEQLYSTLSNQGIDPNSEQIGLLNQGVIYINQQEINKGLETWKAIEAMKLNASLSTIVLTYSGTEEVQEVGFGFDKIDLLFAPKGSEIINKLPQEAKEKIGKIVEV